MVAVNDDGDEVVREVRRGEDVHGAVRTYTIDRVELNPARVEMVSKESDSAAVERIELMATTTTETPAEEPVTEPI